MNLLRVFIICFKPLWQKADKTMNNENLIQLTYDDMQVMKKRLDGMDKRFDGIDERLDGMDKRFDGMDKRFCGVDQQFVSINERFDRLESKVQENTDAIRRINLRIENEIIPSIGFIADGHLDLNRKMDRILETFEKNEKDKETLTLRLNHVEGEVGRLKEKVAKLA